MVIIAFCTKTSKIMPRILCRHFRHCAPIIPNRGHTARPYTMYQCVRGGRVVKLPLNMRDIKILRRAGWVFIWTDYDAPDKIRHARTCVGLCCNAIGISHRTIFTPDDLYRYLRGQQ